MNTEDRRANRNRGRNAEESRTVTPTQRAFWQAITVGELETMQVLLHHKDVDINMYDDAGEQRVGCTALHLAILEMPTWKTEGRSEGRNGIQTAEYVKKFFATLLEHGANIDKPCKYNSEWYLQTAAGKTKSVYPEGYDAIGLVLQFVEITRGAEVISTNVTRRLELIRDLLLEHIKADPEPPRAIKYSTLVDDMAFAFDSGKFADVQLICENEVVPAHRVVLAARSAVFMAMLGSETFKESISRKVMVEETDPAALKIFVQFLYSDSLDQHPVSSDFSLCHNLIMLSNRYDVQALRGKCSEIILKHHLNVEKAAQILRIAHENHVDDLKEQTLTFISNPKNVDDVMKTKDFRTLESDLVQEVLKTVLAGRPSPTRRKLHSPSQSSTKRARTMDLSDEDAVRAPPNDGEEGDEDN